MAHRRESIRLNVAAILGEGVVGRVLIVIDENSSVEELIAKIEQGLRASRIEGNVLRLLNSSEACLPMDERVGDMLRDAEEVVVVLTQNTSQVGTGGMNLQDGEKGGPLEAFYEISDDEEEGMKDKKKPKQVAPTRILGPSELCEADLVQTGKGKGKLPGATMEFLGGQQTFETDWLVENLTPKLREYVSSRFQEAHVSLAGGSFISVLMKPLSRVGADSGTALPVHYNLARVDVIEFERLCQRNLEQTRHQLTYLRKSHFALQSLRKKGIKESEYAENMLPYTYKMSGARQELIEEAEAGGQAFGNTEGFRPVIIVDTSGAIGQHLVYVRAALKRMIYSFLVNKSKFNLVKFTSSGVAKQWASSMVPPTAQVLREAEEWMDSLSPLKGSVNFMDALHLALAPPECDAVYVVTSGLPRRSDPDYFLKRLYTLNVREVACHVIAVESEPAEELALRRLTEENHGTFRQKRFDGGALFQSADIWLPEDAGGDAADEAHRIDTRLTVGGQLSVIEVMIEEHRRQECDWLEEQKCANRLLLTTASQQPVPTRKVQREIDRKRQLSGSAKLGGGFVYNDDPPDTTLQDLFGAPQVPQWEASGEPILYNPSWSRQPPGNDRRSLPNPGDRPRWNTRTGVGQQEGFGTSNQVRAPSLGSDVLHDLRRPSLVNPWAQQSGAVVRVSEQAKRVQQGVPGGSQGSRAKSPGAAGRAKSPGAAGRAVSPARAGGASVRAKSPVCSGGGGPRGGGGARRVQQPLAQGTELSGAMGVVGRERRWSF